VRRPAFARTFFVHRAAFARTCCLTVAKMSIIFIIIWQVRLRTAIAK
jgi:hypothetical protein